MASAVGRTLRHAKHFGSVFQSIRCQCGSLDINYSARISRFHSRKFPQENVNTIISKYSLYGCAAVASVTTAVLALRQADHANPFLGKVCAAVDENTSKPSKRQQWNFIADVVEKTAPAVVFIELKGRHPFGGNQMITLSNGSGFIVREDGLILTNAHVVANKESVKVKLKDGRTYDGVVQAVDPISDLATVKINATNLPVIPLGQSKDLRPGEWVLALGSPFQLSNTVTAGIVSTVSRGSKELGLHKDMDYIQTDAVINFGNSGGPLVNLDGEAIGINTMKVTTGISFAIPSDYAKQFLTKAGELEKRTRSSRRSWFGADNKQKQRYVGITMLTLSPDIVNELRARQNDIHPEAEKGVFISRVIVESPAYSSGIRPGDIITQINGKATTSATDIYNAVNSGESLRVTVYRQNDTLHLTMVPEAVD